MILTDRPSDNEMCACIHVLGFLLTTETPSGILIEFWLAVVEQTLHSMGYESFSITSVSCSKSWETRDSHSMLGKIPQHHALWCQSH